MNWLILRGLIREQRHWEHFPKVFEEKVPGAKVFCLDYPGIGTEHGRKSPYSIAEIQEDLRTRWLELKKKNPGDWSILAVSLGGMVSMEWTRKYPDDFKNFVVINSSISNLSPFYDRMQLPTAMKLLSLFLKGDAEYRERTILEQTTSGRTPIEQVLKHWISFAPPRGELKQVAAAQLLAGMKFKAHEAPQIPVLVLTSEKDGLASTRCSQRIAQLFKAPIHSHPWAGHDLTLEDSPWVADQVVTWLNNRT